MGAKFRTAFVLVSLLLSGCSFSFDWIEYLRAQRAVLRHDYQAAMMLFQDLINRKPDSDRALTAARQGARIAHLEAKSYGQAVDFYRHIILRSPDPEERKAAQKYVAQIIFENLQDYERAVSEYERLIPLAGSKEEAFRYRMNLAKSHFHLNNLDQAANELDVILGQKLEPDEIYETKVLKANIMVSAKKLNEAAGLWEDILKQFPERSQKENVALNLVVCYEELKDFGKAIEVLERMKPDYPNPKFLDVRIQRLKERKQNQPGAQGWKR